MTRKSYFHNGTVIGDANLAPYTAETFADVWKKLLASDGGHVLPGIANNLEVTAGAGRSVNVNTGRAFAFGIYYTNTASVNLTLDTNTSDYPRIDRIVLRVDFTAQTARLVVVKGTPAALPVLPTIDNCEDYREMPLGRIYLPAAYAAASSSYVFDERQFANNPYHQNHYTLENTIINSEFMSFSRSAIPDPGYTVACGDGWTPIAGAAVTIIPYNRFSFMRRGRTCLVDTTEVDSPPANVGASVTTVTSENDTDMFTLRVWVEVYVGTCRLQWAGQTRLIEAGSGPQEIILRVNATGYHTLQLDTNAATATKFRFGMATLAHGYIVAEPVHYGDEWVLFDRYAWKAYDAQSTGLIADISSDIWESPTYDNMPTITSGAKALIVVMSARDSGSAASTTTQAAIQSVATNNDLLDVWLAGIPNDVYQHKLGIIYAEDLNINEDDAFTFDLNIVASGAGTMDIILYLVGIII